MTFTPYHAPMESTSKKRKTPHQGEEPLAENLHALTNDLRTLRRHIGQLEKDIELPDGKDLLGSFRASVHSLQELLKRFKGMIDQPTPEKSYQCPNCPNKRYTRIDRLYKHCDREHTDRNFLTMGCPCPRVFTNLATRNIHLRKIHPEDFENEQQRIRKFLRARHWYI